MPARPRIPDPQEGPLQAFAYDLRELGEGKVSVAWIAGYDETTVSRAALYAALSGTRLPKEETVSTLLRWWVGNPAIEGPDEENYLIDPTWAWINRLPRHKENRQLAREWRARYQRLARDILGKRHFRPRAAPVVIDVPTEQQRFIGELNDLIGKTGLGDELWFLWGTYTPRMERYLAGKSIPTNDTCWILAERLAEFIPDSTFHDLGIRLVQSAEVARLARVRDRRIARERRRGETAAATE